MDQQENLTLVKTTAELHLLEDEFMAFARETESDGIHMDNT
jgi:hypothetical protein